MTKGDYTPEQIGPIVIDTIGGRTKDQFSLLVMQPGSNDQIVVVEPCSWNVGRSRTVSMVRAGVDPADIRFVFRKRDQLDTDGLPLRPCREALWWTYQDQARLDAEAANNVGAQDA